MKRAVSIGTLLSFVASQAMAVNCTDGAVKPSAANLTSLLQGKSVCNASGPIQWNEKHDGAASGNIVEYGMGENEVIGTYSIASEGPVGAEYGVVTYDYGNGFVYSYFAKRIKVLGGVYTLWFCTTHSNDGLDMIVKVQTGHC